MWNYSSSNTSRSVSLHASLQSLSKHVCFCFYEETVLWADLTLQKYSTCSPQSCYNVIFLFKKLHKLTLSSLPNSPDCIPCLQKHHNLNLNSFAETHHSIRSNLLKSEWNLGKENTKFFVSGFSCPWLLFFKWINKNLFCFVYTNPRLPIILYCTNLLRPCNSFWEQ